MSFTDLHSMSGHHNNPSLGRSCWGAERMPTLDLDMPMIFYGVDAEVNDLGCFTV